MTGVAVASPHTRTKKLHIVERYQRVDFGHMEVQVTVEDPGVLHSQNERETSGEFG